MRTETRSCEQTPGVAAAGVRRAEDHWRLLPQWCCDCEAGRKLSGYGGGFKVSGLLFASQGCSPGCRSLLMIYLAMPKRRRQPRAKLLRAKLLKARHAPMIQSAKQLPACPCGHRTSPQNLLIRIFPAPESDSEQGRAADRLFWLVALLACGLPLDRSNFRLSS